MKKLIDDLLKLQTLQTAAAKDAKPSPQIAALRAEIPLPILAHFDRLVARGKKGIAVIRRQVCSACHVQVPRNVELTLMHGGDIQLCENCGCYLALPETAPVELPKLATKARRKRAVAVAAA